MTEEATPPAEGTPPAIPASDTPAIPTPPKDNTGDSGEGATTPKAKTPPPPKPSKAEDLISQANAAAARQEAANERLAELLKKQEELNVEKTLGGKTDAGQPMKLDETPLEYKNRIMKGEV